MRAREDDKTFVSFVVHKYDSFMWLYVGPCFRLMQSCEEKRGEMMCCSTVEKRGNVLVVRPRGSPTDRLVKHARLYSLCPQSFSYWWVVEHNKVTSGSVD